VMFISYCSCELIVVRYSVSDWVLWWVSWRLTCIINNDWQLLTMYHLLSLQVVLAAYLNIPCCSHICVSHLSSYVFNVAAQVSLLMYLFPHVMLWWMSDVLVSFFYGSRLSHESNECTIISTFHTYMFVNHQVFTTSP
jgi:hypothetical protein